MSEKQKLILEKVANAIPNMTEFEKGYLTCLVETRSKEIERKQTELSATGTKEPEIAG